MADSKEVKAPPAPQLILAGTLFIKNPFGAIHDVSEDDPRTAPVVEQAKKAHNGWSLASAAEIAEYCERNNLVPPGKKAKKEAAEPAAEEAEAALAEPAPEEPAPAEAPKKKTRGRRSKK